VNKDCSTIERQLPPGVPASLDHSKVSPVVMETLADASRSKEWPVYLVGSTGTGKTCAAVSAYMRCKSRWVMYRNFAQFCDLVNACKADGGRGNVTEWVAGQPVTWVMGSLWHAVQHCNFLVLDEIGTRTDLDSRVDTLNRVLDLRCGKPLLLTGNIPLINLESHFDARVASRIVDGYVVEMSGKDLRYDGAKQRKRKVVVE
jgi:DNA replication protein DnaC